MKILATALIVAGAVATTNGSALAANSAQCSAAATAYANSVANPAAGTLVGGGVGGAVGAVATNAIGGSGGGKVLLGSLAGGTVGALLGNAGEKKKWQNAHAAEYARCMAG